MTVREESTRIAADFTVGGKWRPILLLVAFVVGAYIVLQFLPEHFASALYSYLTKLF